jgi:glutaredoxin-related protein
MMNKIEILCPGRNCPKCKRFVRYFENFVIDNNIEAEIIVLTSLKEFLRFKTWLLPSVFINDIKVGRGYIPNEKKIWDAFNI